MPVSRRVVNVFRYVLEDLLPPALRDSPLFLPLMHLAFGARAKQVIGFRSAVGAMSDEEYLACYAAVNPISGEVDLNRACIERILADVTGETILDAGCGRGYLIALIAKANPRASCVGLDIAPPQMTAPSENLSFVEGWLCALPFADASFDTAICTHTLEHILDIDGALAELRRVARRRLIVVVPREREYRYAFNLHVHFFPYLHSFLNRIGAPAGRFVCEIVDGDIYYREELGPGSAGS